MTPCWSWPAGALPCWHRCCMMLTWLPAECLPRKQMANQVGVRPHKRSSSRLQACSAGHVFTLLNAEAM